MKPSLDHLEVFLDHSLPLMGDFSSPDVCWMSTRGMLGSQKGLGRCQGQVLDMSIRDTNLGPQPWALELLCTKHLGWLQEG